MLTPNQVDLSKLFPKLSVAEGHPVKSMPVLLSGEKRQAVCTSTPIPPGKNTERVDRECSGVWFQDYLYVIFCLCTTCSSYHKGPNI